MPQTRSQTRRAREAAQANATATQQAPVQGANPLMQQARVWVATLFTPNGILQMNIAMPDQAPSEDLMSFLPDLLNHIIQQHAMPVEKPQRPLSFLPQFSRTVDDTPLLKAPHAAKSPATVHDAIKCPISGKMLNNGIVLSDGYTYHPSVVDSVLSKGSSPVTGQWLNPEFKKPNYHLSKLIAAIQQRWSMPNVELELECPITKCALEQPIVLSSGHTVESSTVPQLTKCPITRELLNTRMMVENNTLTRLVQCLQAQEQQRAPHHANKPQ